MNEITLWSEVSATEGAQHILFQNVGTCIWAKYLNYSPVCIVIKRFADIILVFFPSFYEDCSSIPRSF